MTKSMTYEKVEARIISHIGIVRSRGNSHTLSVRQKGIIVDFDRVVVIVLGSIIAIGLLILGGNVMFNPIRELAAAEALRPTLIKTDMETLDAQLKEANAEVSAEEYLEQKNEYALLDEEGAIEAALEEQSRVSSEEERDFPNTRIAGTNVPPNVNEECQLPIKKALDIERVLSKAVDPQTSIWLEEYCSYRSKMWDKQCYVPNDYLYYGDLCKQVTASL